MYPHVGALTEGFRLVALYNDKKQLHTVFYVLLCAQCFLNAVQNLVMSYINIEKAEA